MSIQLKLSHFYILIVLTILTLDHPVLAVGRKSILPQDASIRCRNLLASVNQVSDRSTAARSNPEARDQWKDILGELEIHGFKSDGANIYVATPNGQGLPVTDFFREADVPKFLRTSEYMTLDDSVPAIQRDIDIQNRPMALSNRKLFWVRANEYLPEGLVEFMKTKFEDGTNCFRAALYFNGLTNELGFLSDKSFQQVVETQFVRSGSPNSDIAVIYRHGLPIHTYIPIGNTGWALTKNGTGGLQPLRFMRESDLVLYYRTLQNHADSDRQRFPWEAQSRLVPVSVKYFTLIRNINR